MPRQKQPQILVCFSVLVKSGQQPLDSIGNIRGGAAIANGPGDRSNLAEAPADTEVVGVYHPAIYFDFLSFNADVGDPMLPATIRAASDVESQLFLKIGKPLFEFLREPSRKAFCFRQCELAKFRSRAGHGSACEYRGLDRQGSSFKLVRNCGRVSLWHVDDQQILHGGGTDVAVRVAIRQIRRRAQLLRRDTASQHGGAYVGEARLLLRVNTDVVAMNVRGKVFRFGRVERKSDLPLQFFQEAFRGPTLLQE